VPLQHFARDLSITRLISANEADDLQASEEEKPTKCNKC
jgi:hypothetical protein